MAKVSLTPNGVYSVVDMELISAEITGQGVMQDTVMDDTNFATEKLENGQCVIVDGKTIKNPTSANDKVLLNATACEIYDGVSGRESFAVTKGKGSLPRLFALNQYDVFSTNAVFYDDADFTDLSTLKSAINAGTVYAVPDATRDWKLVKKASLAGTEKTYGQVTDFVTLSNERQGVRIVVQ